MVRAVSKPRGGGSIRSAKVVERRGRIYDELLAASAELFASRGMEQVSVAEILESVGISRRTFYGFFANKYEIVGALLNPIFESGVRELKVLKAGPPDAIIPGIVAFYQRQWDDNRAALALINALEPAAFGHIEAGHRAFGSALKAALEKAEAGGLLRNQSAMYSFKLISRTAIPLLKVYQDHPEQARLYRETMNSLLSPSP